MSKKLHGFMKRPQNGAKHVDALNTQRQQQNYVQFCSGVGMVWKVCRGAGREQAAVDCLYLAPGKIQTKPHRSSN